MDVDPSWKYAAIGCQDRNIRLVQFLSWKYSCNHEWSAQFQHHHYSLVLCHSTLFWGLTSNSVRLFLLSVRGKAEVKVYICRNVHWALGFSLHCSAEQSLSTGERKCAFLGKHTTELWARTSVLWSFLLLKLCPVRSCGVLWSSWDWRNLKLS